MKMKNLVIFLCMFLCVYKETNAIKCWTCTVSAGDIDQRCVTNPGAVESGQTTVNCNKEFCTSKRVEYKDPPGKVQSFYRGCEDNPANQNTIIDDGTYITYYQACRQDMCNGGNGKGIDGDNDFDSDVDGTGMLRVPGTSSAPPTAFGTFLPITGLIILALFLK